MDSGTLFNSASYWFIAKIVGAGLLVLLPFVLGSILFELWLAYRRTKFFASQTHVVLEFKVPRDVFKSPHSMELFFNSLYQVGGEGTWYDVYYLGKTRPWFSLELASIDGNIHFFMWTRKGFKSIIEANLYSQFPGIEVYEVPDYTLPVSFNTEEYSYWATEFELTKADPYPIKTYIDYGLEKDPKEEYKIDPLTPLIEFMGSLSKGHQAWVQIIIRAHKAEDVDPETGKLVDLKWAKAAKKIIFEEVLKDTKGKKKDDGTTEPGRKPTKGEEEVVSAIERSISKFGFDVGIRAMYIAPKDVFSADIGGGIVGGFRNFNSNHLNGFKGTRSPSVKYPWQDKKKKKRNFALSLMLDAYKHRGYFYNEFKNPAFVLNTEELATIYHFPGGGLSTPTFSRIDSKKSDAPSNLPI